MKRSSPIDIILDIKELIDKNDKGLTITDIYTKLDVHKRVAERYVDLLLKLGVIQAIGTSKKVYVPYDIRRNVNIKRLVKDEVSSALERQNAISPKELDKLLEEHPEWKDKQVGDIQDELFKAHKKKIIEGY